MQTAENLDGLVLAEHGAQRLRAAMLPCLGDLEQVLTALPAGQAGVRISNLAGLKPYLAPDGPIGALAGHALGAQGRAVRAILFNKAADNNWSLAWHQDRTICVRERVEAEGYGPWSIKAGLHHVAPPFDLLASMVTLRVHLDDVPATNAPLLIALRSHTYGRVPIDEVANVVAQCGLAACHATAGDVWIYSTPILHASEVALRPGCRRVLQIDFCARDLPEGLHWVGV